MWKLFRVTLSGRASGRGYLVEEVDALWRGRSAAKLYDASGALLLTGGMDARTTSGGIEDIEWTVDQPLTLADSTRQGWDVIQGAMATDIASQSRNAGT